MVNPSRLVPAYLLVMLMAVAVTTSCSEFQECEVDEDCPLPDHACIRSRAGWVTAAYCAPQETPPADTIDPTDTTADTTPLPPGCGEVACAGELAEVPGGLCDGDGLCALACNELSDPPRDDCDDTLENGCETNLASDAEHCGACGHVCAPELEAIHTSGGCVEGMCVPQACLPTYFDLSGTFANGCPIQVDPDAVEVVRELGNEPLAALLAGPAGGAITVAVEGDVVVVEYVPAPGSGLTSSRHETGLVISAPHVVNLDVAATEPAANGSFTVVLRAHDTIMLLSVESNGKLVAMGEFTVTGARVVVATRALTEAVDSELDVFTLDRDGVLHWHTIVPNGVTPVGPGSCAPMDLERACLVTTESLLSTTTSNPFAQFMVLGDGTLLIAVASGDNMAQATLDTGAATLTKAPTSLGDAIGSAGSFELWRDAGDTVRGIVGRDGETNALIFLEYKFVGTALQRTRIRSLTLTREDGSVIVPGVPSGIGSGRYATTTDSGVYFFGDDELEPETARTLRSVRATMAAFADGHLWLQQRIGASTPYDYLLVRVPVVQH